MAYDQEDAIVVNPPQQIETNDEVETSTRNAGQSQESPIVRNEPKTQRTYTFTHEDIKKFAKEEVQEEIERGAFDEIVEANPTLAGTEPDLSGLKVGNQKYKIPSGTNVVANPTLAGTESDLEGLEVGSSKYAIPPRVSANPTLDGTEAALTGLQIGNTKYKAGGGGSALHLYVIRYSTSGAYAAVWFTYLTTNDSITTVADLKADLRDKGFTGSTSLYPIGVTVRSGNNTYQLIKGMFGPSYQNYPAVNYQQNQISIVNDSISISVADGEGDLRDGVITKIY